MTSFLVKNIPMDIDKKQLKEEFKKYGSYSITMVDNKITNTIDANVTYSYQQDAKKAFEKLNGKVLKIVNIKVLFEIIYLLPIKHDFVKKKKKKPEIEQDDTQYINEVYLGKKRNNEDKITIKNEINIARKTAPDLLINNLQKIQKSSPSNSVDDEICFGKESKEGSDN